MKITGFVTKTIGTAMLAGALMLAPEAAQAHVFISVGFAPPAVPLYEQPACPGDGYIWTPGYWQYTDDGYEWVDGSWVLAPYTGALWTPGYWGYGGGGYFWNAGYWGPTVGYYGGINYGFGYFGSGFYGGYWNRGAFFYNREYNHFDGDRGFRNVYDQRVNGFDGRPGGASYARGINNENRGGSFNNGGNRGFSGGNYRGGIGQNGGSGQDYAHVQQPGQIANGSQMRGAYNGSNFAGGRGAYQQAGGGQTRPNGSFGGRSYAMPSTSVNGFRSNRSGSFGGGQRSQPTPSFRSNSGGGFRGGGFHGGGGGFHGGGGHR